MSAIIKYNKVESVPFVKTNTNIFLNPNLTGDALRLFTLCTNNAIEWKLNITYFGKILKWGYTKLSREFKCLVDNGYASRIRIHGEYHYTFSDKGDLNTAPMQTENEIEVKAKQDHQPVKVESKAKTVPQPVEIKPKIELKAEIPIQPKIEPIKNNIELKPIIMKKEIKTEVKTLIDETIQIEINKLIASDIENKYDKDNYKSLIKSVTEYLSQRLGMQGDLQHTEDYIAKCQEIINGKRRMDWMLDTVLPNNC